MSDDAHETFDPDKLDAAGLTLAARVLQTIARVVAPGVAQSAETIVLVVRLMVDEFQRSTKGEITAKTVESELRRYLKALDENDVAADEALRRKFGRMTDPE